MNDSKPPFPPDPQSPNENDAHENPSSQGSSLKPEPSNVQKAFDQSPYSQPAFSSKNPQEGSYDKGSYDKGENNYWQKPPPGQPSSSQQGFPQQGYPQQQPPPYGPGPGHSTGPSTTAVISFILGLLSWFGLSLLTAIPGVILARTELKRINRREASEEGRIYAQIGFWASAVNLGLSILGLVGFCCFWGVLSSLMGGATMDFNQVMQDNI